MPLAKQEDNRLEIRDFPGLITMADPDDIPAGSATVQVNIGSGKPACLEIRRGYKMVTFEDQA